MYAITERGTLREEPDGVTQSVYSRSLKITVLDLCNVNLITKSFNIPHLSEFTTSK